MQRSRTPSTVPWWFPGSLLVVGFALFVVLLYADHPDIGITVLVVFGVGFIATVVADSVVARRRSRALRARLTPADVAARVDLQALAAAITCGRPDGAFAAALTVQRAFPQLTTADAIEVTRTALPGLLPPRRSPERGAPR